MSQAVFSIIGGDVNPSGKLPITLPNIDNEQQMSRLQYPGLIDYRTGIDLSSNYTEKLLMGYRWYDYHNVEPMYPFGHGLSYTTFKYDAESLSLEDRNVSIAVKNSGNVTGKEVVQLYVGFPEEAGEPPQMLKGFKKIELDPEQSTTVEFTLRDRDLSIWDVDTHAWKLISGDFKIFVGSSSRDIRATSVLTVNTA